MIQFGLLSVLRQIDKLNIRSQLKVKMNHLASQEDREFKEQVESCKFPVSDFDHRAHLRLAYTYLVEGSAAESILLMRNTLINLLTNVGIEPSEKYHETLTAAWILAVQYFMQKTDSSESANDFIERNAVLLNSNLMMTHYSAEVLFSERARKSFVEPDLEPLPRYNT
jgi:hypothetical protein